MRILTNQHKLVTRRRFGHVSFGGLTVGALALTLTGCGKESGEGGDAAAADASAWTTLFSDGTLNGWSTIGDAHWDIADGVVESREGDSYLVSDAVYTDFQLQLEFWVDEPANSGVFLRCSERTTIDDRNAYEVNIFDTREDQTYRTGSIVSVAPPMEVIHTPGKWNNFDITAQGNHLVVVLNGIKTVDIEDDLWSSGPLALQYRAGVVRFRNIRLRDL